MCYFLKVITGGAALYDSSPDIMIVFQKNMRSHHCLLCTGYQSQRFSARLYKCKILSGYNWSQFETENYELLSLDCRSDKTN